MFRVSRVPAAVRRALPEFVEIAGNGDKDRIRSALVDGNAEIWTRPNRTHLTVVTVMYAVALSITAIGTPPPATDEEVAEFLTDAMTAAALMPIEITEADMRLWLTQLQGGEPAYKWRTEPTGFGLHDLCMALAASAAAVRRGGWKRNTIDRIFEQVAHEFEHTRRIRAS